MMYTTLGHIDVWEQTVWHKRTRREMRPLRQACGVRAHACSRRLQRAMTDLAADASFEQAAAKLREHYGVAVPASACRTITLTHAARSQACGIPAASAAQASQLIAEVDGSMVPIVEVDRQAGGDGRKARRLSWKEAKLSLVRRPEQCQPLVAATLGDPQACGAQLYALAEAGGLGKGTAIHAVGDGAPWIAEQVEQQFGKQAHYLLDFYHVCEHLAPVAAYAAPQGDAWLAAQKERLRQGQVAAVLAAVAGYAEAPQQADTPARDCHRYLSARRHQLWYRQAIEADLPIGSGEIESAHRSVIQARLKRAGAWWRSDHAQDMLDLRALRHNGQWEAYWDAFKQAA